MSNRYLFPMIKNAFIEEMRASEPLKIQITGPENIISMLLWLSMKLSDSLAPHAVEFSFMPILEKNTAKFLGLNLELNFKDETEEHF